MQRLNNTARKLAFLAVAMTLLTGAQPRLGGLDDRLLDSHNRERARVGVPPLDWSPDLAQRAQAWADHLSESGKFEHSPNLPGRPLEGENIWGGTPGAFRPEAMVDLWISEKKDFVAGVFPANSQTGRPEDVSHYTQLIWARSGEVGCGLSRKGGEEILVCRYSEPGNVRGRDPFGRDWQKTLAKAQIDQSNLRLPLAVSAAGFASASSALIEGKAPESGSDGLPSLARAPAASSAAIRDRDGSTLVKGSGAAELIANSLRSTACGWSSSNCSWLTD